MTGDEDDAVDQSDSSMGSSMGSSDELLESILDGRSIDWGVGGFGTGIGLDPQRNVRLRRLAGLVAFNRRLQRSGGLAEEFVPDVPAIPANAVRWGSLVLIEILGTGSNGEVWRAWDERLQREVALKFLQSRGSDAGCLAEGESSLLSEARALARLRHPGVVAVHGIAEHDGRTGIWMDRLRGESLASRIERGPLKQAEVARIGAELAVALEAVHEAGLVHGDLKPANVVLEQDGRVVLTDFGLGRPIALGGATHNQPGTPMFMAPEILSGGPPSPRSDIYALGVALHWSLTGRPPFGSRTLAELQVEVARGPAVPLRVGRPQVSATLVSAIERAMAPRAAHRFGRAVELARALLGECEGAQRTPRMLPPETDSFVGREDDLELLEGRLEIGGRLVTLLGPAGMGKTRLAVRYGWQSRDRWPGGVWFCDLIQERSLDGIVSALARSFGVPLSERDSVVQLGHAIASRRRCLVILDNFEQVRDLAGVSVARWLERAPEARWLVTSRESLGVPEEEVQPVMPLPGPSGADLFVDRARRHQPGFAPEGLEAVAVDEIVRWAEGMPLAIELAAARVGMTSVGEIASGLSARAQLRESEAAGRHGSLPSAIEESWVLLRDWEKAAWAQCSSFEGGFTLEAATAVVDLAAWPESPWVLDVIHSLVEKSLLRTWIVDTEPGVRPPGTRFGMYVALQEHARRKIRSNIVGPVKAGGSSDEAIPERRHGEWYARYGAPASLAALDRHDGVKQWWRLEAELENLIAACRRAVERGDGSVAAATYLAICKVFKLRGPIRAALDLGREVLGGTGLGPLERARVGAALGEAAWYSGAMDDAREYLETARALAAEQGDQRLESRVLGDLGAMYLALGRPDAARAHLEPALLAARSLGERHSSGVTLVRLGIMWRDQGMLDQAQTNLEEGLGIHRDVGDRSFESIALVNLGLVQQDRGSLDEARLLYEEALAICRQIRNLLTESGVLANLGGLNLDQGRLGEARLHLEAALALNRQTGSRRSEATTLLNMGELYATLDEGSDAAAAFEEARRIYRELGNRRFEGRAVSWMAEMRRRSGDLDEARKLFDSALAIHREESDARNEGETLTRLARLLRGLRSIEVAREVLVRGESLLRRIDARLELANLLCERVELEQEGGTPIAAGAALHEAEALAARIGAGAQSPLGTALARCRRKAAPRVDRDAR